jgi:chromosome segregation protein
MRLTKLELHGFKSFADSTTLAFDTGVTAIVGPNGCGKSNVSDAVRWVLGEQRARLLRGAKMDEVIFQGSSARRPVSMAEVSLHFDNDDGMLPVAYREVVVTRRLSRSGDSEYLLNRSPCRLRDIHDLMRGTGLGADAGVVIESRMIDALLSDRPDDRRELFEEAAGIGLYRDRRRTTARRLEETSIDLARLDDLVAEVQTQVRSLARQRRRAERYTELMTQRFAVDITLAMRELEAARVELGGLDTSAIELRKRAPESEAAALTAEGQRDTAHRDRATAEASRTELARLVAAQHQQLSALQGEIAVAEERQRNAVARRQRAEDERRMGEVAGSRLLVERDTAASERRGADASVAAARATLETRAAHEDAARQSVAAARQATDAHDQHLRELRDAVAHLDIERASADRERADILDRVAALANERAALADQERSAQREGHDAADEQTTADDQSAAADVQSATVRDEAVAAREAEADAHRMLAGAEASLAEVDGTVSALERLERERVGLAPAAAKLLSARARFGDGAILGPLSDFLVAGTADAGIVERYLGVTVHAVVVRDRAVADAVRQWHAAEDPGPLCLLPLDGVGAAHRDRAPGMRDTPGNGEIGMAGSAPSSLAERVTPAATLGGWADTLLGRVRDLGNGTAFEDGQGAMWLPGTPAGQGPLRRRAELAALRAERTTRAEARDVAARAAAAAQRDLADAQARAVSAGEAAAAADHRARRAREHRAACDRQLDRVRRETQQAAELSDHLTGRADVLTSRIAALVQQRDQTEAQMAEQVSAGTAARSALESAERVQDTSRDARTAAQVEVAQAEARAQVAAERERRLADDYTSATGRLDALHTELQGLSNADVELARQVATWRVDVTARQFALRDAEDRLGAAEAAVRDADTRLVTAEQALDAARHEGAALASELHRIELRRSEVAGREHVTQERLEAEWRRPWDALIDGFVPLDTDGDALRLESADLQAQLTALGPVNALAIEEHGEEVKRLDFLTTQRADLASGRASLQQAIREIDTTARELFLETFSQVRDNFRQIFMTLFGGGECDLRLENPDAPLECDIEIHASPRGKRTQRIHLLSSGERALVALSLLFGIFLTKPSPFCLLDEVDAPLDDQNIGRFVLMLNEFKARTQFIIITHNPRTTTEAADAVYGVTMQEPGISSVVSVRLQPRPVQATTPADSDAAEPALQEV